MSNVKFMIGADPEVFVSKRGVPISAFGLIPGTKEEPFKTAFGAVQVDGMALEFNIDPTVSHDFEGFNNNITHTISSLNKMVPGYKLVFQPVQEFSKEYLDAQPLAAKELGCDPDYNAYTLEENPRPDGERLFRTGAGHIHVGWGADIPVANEEHMQICADFIKMLDATVGLYMTCIDPDPRRRDLYGKAGAMRPKSYGVEYRTPSNMWLTSKLRRKSVHCLVNVAIACMKNGYSVNRVTGRSEETIREIINTGRADIALDALRHIRGTCDYEITRVVRGVENEYLRRIEKEGERRK
jgi:Phage phiEco32-like COOH.NH2 ligase-type 2